MPALEQTATTRYVGSMSKDAWGEGLVYLRGKTYWIQYSLNGKRRRESAKTTDPKKAQRLLRRKLTGAEHGEQPASRVLVGRLLDNLLRFYELNRPKSYAWARIVVEKHLREPFGYLRAADLGTKHVDKYVDDRRVDVKPGTINRELAILRRSFSLGMQNEPPLVNRVPRIPELTEGAPRSGFFEAEDFARLCAELPPDVRDVAMFAYWTGCRKSEILNLRWDQVDFAERLVRLEVTKNGEPREIPMSAHLLVMLSRRIQDSRDWCPLVFSRDGRRIVNFYTSWKSACERAGLSGDGKLLHDLRRTGVRNLIRAGVPEKVAMLISGHKTRSVFDRYHIVATDDVREAMTKLEKHLGKK